MNDMSLSFSSPTFLCVADVVECGEEVLFGPITPFDVSFLQLTMAALVDVFTAWLGTRPKGRRFDQHPNMISVICDSMASYHKASGGAHVPTILNCAIPRMWESAKGDQMKTTVFKDDLTLRFESLKSHNLSGSLHAELQRLLVPRSGTLVVCLSWALDAKQGAEAAVQDCVYVAFSLDTVIHMNGNEDVVHELELSGDDIVACWNTRQRFWASELVAHKVTDGSREQYPLVSLMLTTCKIALQKYTTTTQLPPRESTDVPEKGEDSADSDLGAVATPAPEAPRERDLSRMYTASVVSSIDEDADSILQPILPVRISPPGETPHEGLRGWIELDKRRWWLDDQEEEEEKRPEPQIQDHLFAIVVCPVRPRPYFVGTGVDKKMVASIVEHGAERTGSVITCLGWVRREPSASSDAKSVSTFGILHTRVQADWWTHSNALERRHIRHAFAKTLRAFCTDMRVEYVDINADEVVELSHTDAFAHPNVWWGGFAMDSVVMEHSTAQVRVLRV